MRSHSTCLSRLLIVSDGLAVVKGLCKLERNVPWELQRVIVNLVSSQMADRHCPCCPLPGQLRIGWGFYFVTVSIIVYSHLRVPIPQAPCFLYSVSSTLWMPGQAPASGFLLSSPACSQYLFWEQSPKGKKLAW